MALRRGGYRVEEAADGKEALAKILSAQDAGDPFDLVVTDIRMPAMSGIELIDALVERGDRTAVCAITCFGDQVSYRGARRERLHRAPGKTVRSGEAGGVGRRAAGGEEE